MRPRRKSIRAPGAGPGTGTDGGLGAAGTGGQSPFNLDAAPGDEPDADAEQAPVCGDLLINQVGEECDDGNRVGNDGCTAACKREPLYDCPATGGPCTPLMVCGDLAITAIRKCDDGNTTPGDGCSARCQVEASYYDCPNNNGVGGPCISTVACGDGRVEAGEMRDANTVGGDGCAADCFAVETGWICRKPGAPCTPQCGDGRITGSEECDDTNAPPATVALPPASSSRAGPARATERVPVICGNASWSPASPAISATTMACSTATATVARRPAPRNPTAARPG